MSTPRTHRPLLGARPLLAEPVWQMNYGERVALEGLLAVVQPQLAVEIGTAEGGSLRRIAAHATEVHSLDLVEPSLPDIPGHVTFHTGEGHELLPALLGRLSDEGRGVDFVLVDGDHTSDGVRQDIEDLLASPAITETLIAVHDTANEEVRQGLDAVDYAAHPKVTHVDFDLVPGHLGADAFPGEIWGGMGIIVVSSVPVLAVGEPVQTAHHHAGAMLAIARDHLAAQEGMIADLPLAAAPEAARDGAATDAVEAAARLSALKAEVEHHRQLVQALMASPSWKVTAPLRAAKARLLRR